MNPFFIVDTSKSFEAACSALSVSVSAHQFGILAEHDLGGTLRGKGIDFIEQCHVFEICNPQQAATVLNLRMELNMALPCRISVYTEAGQTRIGMIRPEPMLRALSNDPRLLEVAHQVEASTMAIIEQAAGQAWLSAGSTAEGKG